MGNVQPPSFSLSDNRFIGKNVSLSRRQAVQLRLEMFNVFNTAQFYGAGSVDGNVSSSTFGQIVRAAPPRLVQLAVKYSF